MVAEPIVETPPVSEPVPVEDVQTETPSVEDEGVAEPPKETAELQVEVETPKPEYLTREEAERIVEERADKIRADEREAERRRRQTEGARRASQEKRDADERAELADSIRAAFIEEQGVAPPTEKILSSVDRLVRKRTEQIGLANLDIVEQAWDFVTATAYGNDVELDEAFEPAARRLAPKLQHLIDTIRPTIEASARKGYILESELPAKVEAEIARRAAKSRNGQTELQRPEGLPSTVDRAHQPTIDRVARGLGDEQDAKYAADYVERIRTK